MLSLVGMVRISKQRKKKKSRTLRRPANRKD